MSAPRLLSGAIAAIGLVWLAAPPALAGEVDFSALPFGARRSDLTQLSTTRSGERAGLAYYLRKEKDMRFAGAQLYGVYYGFAQELLVAVEAQTFPADPVGRSCLDTRPAKAIREKMRSLFGRRIRHVGDYSSSPEEYERNLEDFDACKAAFAVHKDVSCEVDVFEKWKDGAKDADRALEAVLHEVSVGRPIQNCVVHVVFRPGRTLADKRAEGQAEEQVQEDILDPFGVD